MRHICRSQQTTWGVSCEVSSVIVSFTQAMTWVLDGLGEGLKGSRAQPAMVADPGAVRQCPGGGGRVERGVRRRITGKITLARADCQFFSGCAGS